MKSFGLPWVLLAFAVVVLAAGVPYWRIPYAELNRGHFVVWPGALLLGFLTGLLTLLRVAPARPIALTMLGCVPVIVGVSIAKDIALDPTSHNLWPLELLFAALAGATIVLPAVLLGMGGHWLMTRTAAR